MKRIGVSILLVATLLVSALPNANAVITPGSKCSKAGVKQTYKGKVYTCIKLGKKLYWNNGVKVTSPKPTPTPTKSSDNSIEQSPSKLELQLNYNRRDPYYKGWNITIEKRTKANKVSKTNINNYQFDNVGQFGAVSNFVVEDLSGFTSLSIKVRHTNWESLYIEPEHSIDLSQLRKSKLEIWIKQSDPETYLQIPYVPILKSSNRQLVNQLDTTQDSQIKPIYLVPSDSEDKKRDTNGTIANLLDQGNSMLQRYLNRTLRIDTYNNFYDIQFFRSKYTSKEIWDAKSSDLQLLFTELNIQSSATFPRVNYILFVEMPQFYGACGRGNIPGSISIVAIGEELTNDGFTTCVSGPTKDEFSHGVQSWVHEIFHNFGVNHNTDPCDLMAGDDGKGNLCNSPFNIDASRTKYVGASIFGVNILTLKVWASEP